MNVLTNLASDNVVKTMSHLSYLILAIFLIILLKTRAPNTLFILLVCIAGYLIHLRQNSSLLLSGMFIFGLRLCMMTEDINIKEKIINHLWEIPLWVIISAYGNISFV